MATTNYVKVRYEDRCTEFFFNGDDPVSVESTRRTAWEYADALLFIGGKKAVHISVWEHRAEFPGVTCIGGCAKCSPASHVSDEDEVDAG